VILNDIIQQIKEQFIHWFSQLTYFAKLDNTYIIFKSTFEPEKSILHVKHSMQPDLDVQHTH